MNCFGKVEDCVLEYFNEDWEGEISKIREKECKCGGLEVNCLRSDELV